MPFHEVCFKANEAGCSTDEIKAAQARAAATPRPLTSLGVFFAVFWALCLYGVVSGIFGAAIHELSH